MILSVLNLNIKKKSPGLVPEIYLTFSIPMFGGSNI
jgi:hypothetical protein